MKAIEARDRHKGMTTDRVNCLDNRSREVLRFVRRNNVALTSSVRGVFCDLFEEMILFSLICSWGILNGGACLHQ